LIDAVTGNHLWAEKYNRVLEEIFEIQEELTQGIVSVIAPHIHFAEREKVHRRRPESLSAYERAVSALAKQRAGFLNADVGLCNEALAEAQAALAIDPRCRLALQVTAWGQLLHLVLGTGPDVDAAWQEGLVTATRAIEFNPNGSNAYAVKAVLLGYSADKQRAPEALPNARRACELNPNSTWAILALVFSELWAGLAGSKADLVEVG
jgi:adenylate cyclase